MPALLLLAGALFGLALGWYLRRINTWCLRCGDVMMCPSCTRTSRSTSPQSLGGLPIEPPTRPVTNRHPIGSPPSHPR